MPVDSSIRYCPMHLFPAHKYQKMLSDLIPPPPSPRPSTPVFDLLEHRYQERWLQERKEAERKQREKNSKKVCNPIARQTYAVLCISYHTYLIC